MRYDRARHGGRHGCDWYSGLPLSPLCAGAVRAIRRGRQSFIRSWRPSPPRLADTRVARVSCAYSATRARVGWRKVGECDDVSFLWLWI